MLGGAPLLAPVTTLVKAELLFLAEAPRRDVHVTLHGSSPDAPDAGSEAESSYCDADHTTWARDALAKQLLLRIGDDQRDPLLADDSPVSRSRPPAA
jgi:hypothetical protein